jgi:hypothetical protein
MRSEWILRISRKYVLRLAVGSHPSDEKINYLFREGRPQAKAIENPAAAWKEVKTKSWHTMRRHLQINLIRPRIPKTLHETYIGCSRSVHRLDQCRGRRKSFDRSIRTEIVRSKMKNKYSVNRLLGCLSRQFTLRNK